MTTLKIFKHLDNYVICDKDGIICRFSSFNELYNQVNAYAKEREFNFFIDKSISAEEKRSLDRMILKITEIYFDKKPDDETRVL
ncbi:MAG: hypothetical protein AB1571_01325 [Nanoarchaeota archaeon]